MTTYSKKKQQCKQRMIEFNFTEQEWKEFNKLKHSVVCAYTGQTFVDKVDHPNYPTCERIDDTKGYSVDNCVWVANRANWLKAVYIESGKDESDLSVGDTNYLKRIKRIVSNVECIKEIQKPYKHLFNNETKQKGTKMTEIKTNNPELKLSYDYLLFGGGVENDLKQELNISFAEYKRLINRKKCQLTGVVFDEDNKPSLWVKDKSATVTKDNVLVVNKNIKEGIDSFTKNNDLSVADLKKICTMLSSVL